MAAGDKEKVNQICELADWFVEEGILLPPGMQVSVIDAACRMLESLGYIVHLDPGEMPS